MKIVFQKDYDGYKKDQVCFVERTLGRRFCEDIIAIPYQQHLINVYDAEQAKIAAKEKAKAEKAKADEKKKADLLAKKKSAKPENAYSKKIDKGERAIKK